jgi:hypothetical protein
VLFQQQLPLVAFSTARRGKGNSSILLFTSSIYQNKLINLNIFKIEVPIVIQEGKERK